MIPKIGLNSIPFKSVKIDDIKEGDRFIINNQFNRGYLHPAHFKQGDIIVAKKPKEDWASNCLELRSKETNKPFEDTYGQQGTVIKYLDKI